MTARTPHVDHFHILTVFPVWSVSLVQKLLFHMMGGARKHRLLEPCAEGVRCSAVEFHVEDGNRDTSGRSLCDLHFLNSTRWQRILSDDTFRAHERYTPRWYAHWYTPMPECLWRWYTPPSALPCCRRRLLRCFTALNCSKTVSPQSRCH